MLALLLALAMTEAAATPPPEPQRRPPGFDPEDPEGVREEIVALAAMFAPHVEGGVEGRLDLVPEGWCVSLTKGDGSHLARVVVPTARAAMNALINALREPEKAAIQPGQRVCPKCARIVKQGRYCTGYGHHARAVEA